MKTNTLLFILIVIAHTVIGQTLEKSAIDEFTKQKVEETSFEPLVQNFTVNAFLAVRSINDSLNFVRLKLMIGVKPQVHAIEKGASFYLKLSDESVIELKCAEYSLSCTGCGARGFSASGAQGTRSYYYLTADQVNELKKKPIKKFRIHTSEGTVEADIKDMRSDILMKELALVD